MKSKQPYYSKRTKREVVFDYENGRATAKELARLYGILGSNTIKDWVKKYGKLDVKNLMKQPKPNPNVSKEHNIRRQRNYEQIQISVLENELDEARLKIRLYACALQVASEATGIDLLKKTGELLQQERMKKR